MRADIYLHIFGYVKSRQKAKTLIEGGYVFLNGDKIAKPSFEIDETILHEVTINDNCIYVSRGGLKLEAILNYANIDVNDKICIDIGASTGGFTDCLLKRGAK
jgi:23S rRNA (cytidine1920-2'-O)/16S rRNA (cytidine1409-2'-O)-methyltransferase